MTQTTITKSIRLTQDESAELARLSQETAITEAALMRKWVQGGMRAQKLDTAIQAYMQRRVDLRGGAALADVSYNLFLQEVQARNIVVLDDEGFLDRLGYLADVFADQSLQKILADGVQEL